MKRVSRENFDERQKAFIETFKGSVRTISSQTDVILGAKDIHSRHLVATDAYARLVGLARGADVADRLDRDKPCEGTAQFADCYVREDQELLHHSGIEWKKSVLNVHEYDHGIDALVFEKYLLKHNASRSILRTVYTARRIKVAELLFLVPELFSGGWSGIQHRECQQARKRGKCQAHGLRA